MKKFIGLILSAALIAAPVIPAAAEENTISVIVDNEKVEFDQSPVIDNGRTLVPLRAVFEKAGAVVDWNQETQTATVQKGSYVVEITLNDNYLYKNGEAIELDVPAKIINDRTLIPVRAIGEAMDFAVAWDGFHSQVVVSTNGKTMRPYAARRYAFSTLEDAAIYYNDRSFSWQNVDIDGDGSQDTVSFTVSKDTASEQTPLLIINGENLTDQIKFMDATVSFAVVDIDKSDSTTEIVITAGNDDTNAAYFFRYANNTLSPIMKDESRAKIIYHSQLFLDQKSYILSDLEGLTWTDIMLTGSAYQLENNIITQYYVSNAGNMLPRLLVNTYDSDMVYNVYYTDIFTPGTYRKDPDALVKASELGSFTVQDMYIDNITPEYVEFFITLTDGPNMVISPYKP